MASTPGVIGASNWLSSPEHSVGATRASSTSPGRQGPDAGRPVAGPRSGSAMLEGLGQRKVRDRNRREGSVQMTLLQWREHNRETLGEALPEAVVVLPVGATEQHGRHLATGTDALLAETTVRRAT